MAEHKGALPSQTIRELIGKGHILSAREEHVQPASLDLTLSHEVYRVDGLFLPRASETVRDVLERVHPIAVPPESVLEVGVPYLARLNEKLNLPADLYAYVNPKSSTGRTDVKISLIADGISRFDSVGKAGYIGELWIFIEPKSFRVRLPKDEALVQIRFFNADTRLSEAALKDLYEKEKILYSKEGSPIHFDALKISDRDGGLVLTVDLKGDMIGFRADGATSILDFAKRSFYDPADFFMPIAEPKRGALFLRKGSFYIFYTREYVRVPVTHSCEMVPVDIRNGEFRSHYAGYIDPGWGYGEDGATLGRPLVLEVRPFDDNILLYHGQPICKLIFERMAEVPDMVYGQSAAGSHYFSQTGPVLSKHFKQ
ncbi:MAG: 2'-deoxycytidine 5'-triphosphate deaminase [Candidatus Ryanbacteria bacterium]|nr:2'-deoxycytidine 5'-triphosphate deaminase [Candidatus Ryanbacteria bacterium]